jgi:hypothetical protein
LFRAAEFETRFATCLIRLHSSRHVFLLEQLRVPANFRIEFAFCAPMAKKIFECVEQIELRAR